MTHEEIQERNKQIALMLGKKEYLEYWKNWVDIEAKLKWHSDWNWLHEAVEFVHLNTYPSDSIKHDIIQLLGRSQKEAVFIAVSDFAKRYNDKKL